MFQGNKNVFWEAFVVAAIIFAIGMLIGVALENWRSSQIQNLYSQSDLDLLDLKVQSDLLNLPNFNCQTAIKENIAFGDSIFQQALLLQQYEESQTLTNALEQEHKKFDLLRTLFWTNSIQIKQRCNSNFHTVVYIYKYNTDIDTRAKQSTFSRSLTDLKDKYQNNIILIPIAGNMNLSSTQSLMDLYNVTTLPAIIVDEKTIFTNIEDLPKIENLVK